MTISLASRHQERIRIRGQVQGVGFRPAVWRLARRFDIAGEVRNDGGGVEIIAQSSRAVICQMLDELQQQPPPLARIDSIEREVIAAAPFESFSISQSVHDDIHTAIVADAATCDACIAEIFDPKNRRHGYAFTNCTHCGPRLSIIEQLPYDRANTSMAGFTMCAACRQEYENPQDRRFHAQPNACPDCGPRLSLCERDGAPIETNDAIGRTAELIRSGQIVAIKGIGGFQLACDASNQQTVLRLRERKHRPHKALALMATSLDQIQNYAQLSDAESDLLSASAAPIVLLDSKPRHDLAPAIAQGLNTLGFMLPNRPLHHLLLQRLDAPIVLTSGNAANSPQCIDNQQSLQQLGQIADAFLLHDRPIVNRIDDSVTRVMSGQAYIYRRARGFAPQPVSLPAGLGSAPILACGSEMKNAFCLARDGQATLSQHIGNLDKLQNWQDFEHNLHLFERLYDFTPQAIAVDLHPQYQASQFGRKLADEKGLPLIEVQHHHAHIAACLADNGWMPGSEAHQQKVIGIALDGLGFGSDGAIWGGEFLLADYLAFERRARFKPVPMPGGNLASIEPWRNAFAQLHHYFDWNQISDEFAALPLMQSLVDKPLAAIANMITNGLNAPLASSCGRLFDAVAFALGLCPVRQSYEGQAAIELENLIDPRDLKHCRAYPFALQYKEFIEIDAHPMWRCLLQDLAAGVSRSKISAAFHAGLAEIIVEVAQRLRDDGGFDTVALSGGVFQNRCLLRLCLQRLTQSRFTVLQHQNTPANDGGLAYGQAVVAAAHLQSTES